MILLFSGIIVFLTGVILYITPQGRVTYWNDWGFLGLSKTAFTVLHINLSFLFLFTSFIHIAYNWKPIISYITNSPKAFRLPSLNSTIALAVTLLFTLGTYYKWIPFQTIINLGEKAKQDLWANNSEPPYGHAELSSLRGLAEKTKLDLVEMEKNLKSKGILFNSVEEKVLDVSRKNKLAPSQLFAIMSQGANVAGEASKIPSFGLGRLTLKEVATLLKKDETELQKKLIQKGFKIENGMTLKEIAEQKNMTAQELKTNIENEALK